MAVRDGRIVAVEDFDADLEASRYEQLDDDHVLLPGLVDSHVHVNEPGRTQWEGFVTATRAAAAGGVTTVIDMPLNSIPPTTTPEALAVKRQAAEGTVYVDVGFWGGAIPANVPPLGTAAPDLAGLHAAGVFGFKCFLLHSGVDEFPGLDAGQLEQAMAALASVGATLLVHAEDEATIGASPVPASEKYRDFLASRPKAAENVAITRVLELAARTGCRIHIVHLSSADGLELITKARARGVDVTVETCPHYLTFAAELIPDGATEYKCCPPIRETDNREALWEGLRAGVIDAVVSDHSPCTPDLKGFYAGSFDQAWGGISSLQLGLAAVWTGARRRGYTLSDVVRWMAEGPARVAGLKDKGRIAPGCHADFAVFAPDQTMVVDGDKLMHRNPVTPYSGRALTGVVQQTWLRGQPIDFDGSPRGVLFERVDR